MEGKLKAFLTSWLPWKLLNKSENLFYFPTHLHLFFMYWFFPWLLSVWEIKQDSSRLAEKKSSWTEKVAVKATIPQPLTAPLKPWRNCSCPVAPELLQTLLTCRSQVCSIPPSLPAPSSISSLGPAISTCTKHLPSQHLWDSHISCCTARCL